ncbi:septum formation family protein [Nocardioides sp.]|uniref:septum formation family protein n=1 Tax=Nocardioides sp. TaxID=35761 RepID=UPI0031FEA8F6|nr:hypothetical protein [Nocardioides sp.]
MPSVPTALMRPVAATLGAALLFVGLAATPSAVAGDPLAGAPVAGDCYNMTLDETNGNNEAGDPVPCGETHTTQVMAVKKLPSDLTWDSDATKVTTAIHNGCGRAYDDTVGSNLKIRYRTQYGVAWFVPTDDEKAQGGRWYSCHVVVRENDRLASLPEQLPKLRLPLPNSVARCVTGLKVYEFTTCADNHNWRSSYTAYVFKKPTDENISRAAKRICPRHVSSRAWLESALTISRAKFLVACYSKTRS